MSAEIFKTYGNNPYDVFDMWFAEAKAGEPHDPEAVCLATADSQGRPSARMVLIKEITPKGFRFHTNTHSRKGDHLSENPYGALCFYWKSLRKQVRAEGQVVPISPAEADEYFASRRRARQVGAWASDQSRPYCGAHIMDEKIVAAERRFECVDDLPRPDYWSGYRLVPSRIEFWVANRERLHTRFEYIKSGQGWGARWVYP